MADPGSHRASLSTKTAQNLPSFIGIEVRFSMWKNQTVPRTIQSYARCSFIHFDRIDVSQALHIQVAIELPIVPRQHRIRRLLIGI